MTQPRLPGVGLIAVPGRWKATLELAGELERRGFEGVYSPSLGDAMALSQAVIQTTTRLRAGTSIVNIYTRHPADYAQTAVALHELSGGRFVFGVGVSHGPMNQHLGVTAGKPLADMSSSTFHRTPAKKVKSSCCCCCCCIMEVEAVS